MSGDFQFITTDSVLQLIEIIRVQKEALDFYAHKMLYNSEPIFTGNFGISPVEKGIEAKESIAKVEEIAGRND